MRFIACGDSLFSSRNLKKRLDQKLVSLLLAADGVFTNAEFCTPEPSTPPAAGRGYMTSVRPSLLDEFRVPEHQDAVLCEQSYGRLRLAGCSRYDECGGEKET